MARINDIDIVSIRQAAELLGISEQAVRARVRRGTLRVYRRKGGGRGMWFKKDDLLGLVADEEQVADSDGDEG